jgi:hypothetical protein
VAATTLRPGSGFACLATYMDLGKAAALYVMIIYVVRKIFKNNRRAISGITKNTIHIDVHMTIFAAVLVWAIVWAIYWSFTWSTDVSRPALPVMISDIQVTRP